MKKKSGSTVGVGALELKFEDQSFPEEPLGSHSLQAEGAMPLQTNGTDRDTIKN